MDEPLLGPLTRLLQKRLRDSKPVRVENLRQFALFETVYRPEHVIKALKPLIDAGTVKIEDGSPLRRASFVSLVHAPPR